jgi:hypothetical protein
VELQVHVHLNNMNRLFIFYLFFTVSSAFAQDTLYLPVHGLGHEKYVLNENETFIYSSHLCGSSFISFGTYKKNMFGYRFNYDTTLCPNPSITELNQTDINDSIILLFYNMVDSTRQPFFDSLVIGEQSYRFNSDSITIPKQSLKSNILTIKEPTNELVFTFDSTITKLQIYLAPMGFGYRCGMNNIRKLKKTKYGYLHKFNVYDEIREEPWKKGTRRVVRHYYQLRD